MTPKPRGSAGATPLGVFALDDHFRLRYTLVHEDKTYRDAASRLYFVHDGPLGSLPDRARRYTGAAHRWPVGNAARRRLAVRASPCVDE